jgi:two-component sensor histidine kinase
LHDLKKALSLLHENAMRHTLTEGDLVDFRQRVRALGPTAERMLKKTLSGWRHDWFDLRAEFVRPAGLLAQVFGKQHDGVNVLGQPEVRIKAPKEQVLLAMRELLSNAKSHTAADTPIPVVVEFQRNDVVIRNSLPVTRSHNELSTGKGMTTAQAWLESCGMPLKQESDESGFSIRVSLPVQPENGAVSHV